MNVKERGDAIGTFRFIAVRLMETTARWTPITPEMEAKIMFGKHIWQYAQHADWLGKRTFELRQPEHYTRTPSAEYLAVLDGLAEAATTGDRLSMLYDAIVPGLVRRYEAYLAETDALLDEPSVVIIERILLDLRRQQQDAVRLREQISIPVAAAEEFARRELAVASPVA
jgi:hypothetical protein